MASVRVDPVRAIERLESKLPQAIARALNRSIASARTLATREIAKDMGVPQGTVRDRLKTREATPATHVAKLSANAKRIPLIDFGARGPNGASKASPMPSRGKGRGVTAGLGRSRGRYPHAFIARTGSGHVGVFQRKGRGKLPIRELKGPSVWKAFGKVRAEALARGLEQLKKNLRSEFRFAMRGK